MRNAVAALPGLRLLRQDYWECLASFILSATKQIVQIQQMVALLAERYGKPIASGGLAGVRFPDHRTNRSLLEASFATQVAVRQPAGAARDILDGNIAWQQLPK